MSDVSPDETDVETTVGSIPDEDISGPAGADVTPNPSPVPTRRSARNRRPPDRIGDWTFSQQAWQSSYKETQLDKFPFAKYVIFIVLSDTPFYVTGLFPLLTSR